MKSFWKFKFIEENSSHFKMEILGCDRKWRGDDGASFPLQLGAGGRWTEARGVAVAGKDGGAARCLEEGNDTGWVVLGRKAVSWVDCGEIQGERVSGHKEKPGWNREWAAKGCFWIYLRLLDSKLKDSNNFKLKFELRQTKINLNKHFWRLFKSELWKIDSNSQIQTKALNGRLLNWFRKRFQNEI
jgi:hypothetical protein